MADNPFTSFFSIPRKNRARAVSIDFGNAVVKIALLESIGQKWELIAYAFKYIALADENREEVKRFISDFLKKNSLLTEEACLTIFDPERIILKHLFLPVLPRSEMAEAIRWQLKKEQPSLKTEDLVLDWQLISESVEQGGVQNNEIICAFADSAFIHTFLDLARDCGLMPTRISSPPFNYANMLKASADISSVAAVLDIGFQESSLCVYKDKRLHFVRRLSFSSDKLTHVLTSGPAADAPQGSLSYEKAEEIKKAIEIPPGEYDASEKDIDSLRIISLIRPLLENLVKELKRSFHYYASTFNTHEPSSMYLTGGGANFKNLAPYLARELAISVSALPLPLSLSVHGLGEAEIRKDQNQITNVVGAVLADAHTVNLLPPEYITEKIERVEIASLRVVAITVSAILLLSLFFVQFQIRDYTKRLTHARSYLAGIKDIEALKRRIDSTQEVVDRLQKDQIPVEGILRLISATIPADTLLDNLTLDQHSHVLIVRGTVAMHEDTAERAISSFIKKMEDSRFVTEARLMAFERTGGVQRFEIKCDLAHEAT